MGILRNQLGATQSGQSTPTDSLTVVIVGDTPYIASAVADSLPPEFSYFVVGHKNLAFLRRSKNCRHYFENDLSPREDNKADFVRAIGQIRDVNSNVFLIPVDDAANRIVSATFKSLGANCYPVPDSVTFEMLTDKWRFYQICLQQGLPVPKSLTFKDKADIDFDAVCAAVGLPFVLKPTNQSNSLGVEIVRSRDQFHRDILSNRKYKFAPLIAQTFIPGIDIDISVMADAGRINHFAIQTRKDGLLCFVQNSALAEFTELFVRNISFTGPMHIDARLETDSGRIYFVEANPRFWGSLGEATFCGLNFVRAGLYDHIGRKSVDPTTIFDVSIPSVRQMVVELMTGKRSYFDLLPPQRRRIHQVVAASARSLLHLPFWFWSV